MPVLKDALEEKVEEATTAWEEQSMVLKLVILCFQPDKPYNHSNLMTTNFRAINFLCVVTLRSCNNFATDRARLKAANQELFKDGWQQSRLSAGALLGFSRL